MRRVVIQLGILAGLVFAVLFLYEPVSRELTFELLLLTLAGLALLWLVDTARSAAPRHRRRSAFDAALRTRPPADDPPGQLVTIRRRVELGSARAADLHFHLRPMLREIASARLESRHGIGLDSPRARTILGEHTWELVRPDAPAPENRFAPGVPLEQLREALDRLEQV